MSRFALIPEWRSAWRMDTMRVSLLLAVLSLVQAELLPLLQADLPSRAWAYVTFGLALAVMLLRLRLQPALHGAAAVEQAEEPPAVSDQAGTETTRHPTEH